MEKVESSRDILLIGLDKGEYNIQGIIADISEEEYLWEPPLLAEQSSDLLLPPEQKRVWRVFQKEGVWIYDYTPEKLDPPPFTTIAWIMNHVAQTADMYLYCVRTGRPEGVERRWDDLPVPSDYQAMSNYIVQVLADVREYLLSIPKRQINGELNKLTPAPWGEMRPTWLNIWGGVVEHVLQHAMQIAGRKDRIRYGY
jgi:DinB superfamily